jgi:hypothetical protein
VFIITLAARLLRCATSLTLVIAVRTPRDVKLDVDTLACAHFAINPFSQLRKLNAAATPILRANIVFPFLLLKKKKSKL